MVVLILIQLKQVQVEFKNVSFKYPDDDEYLLKNISFKVNKGETYCVYWFNW